MTFSIILNCLSDPGYCYSSSTQHLGDVSSPQTVIQNTQNINICQIRGLPAKAVMNALPESVIFSDIEPVCNSYTGVVSCLDESAPNTNYTQKELSAIDNNLTLAKNVPADKALALTDPVGNLLGMYLDNKFYTMTHDGSSYEWSYDGSENPSKPNKASVTDKNLINFYKFMKNLSNNYPSLLDGKEINHKVLDLGLFMVITIQKLKVNEYSESGYVSLISFENFLK